VSCVRIRCRKGRKRKIPFGEDRLMWVGCDRTNLKWSCLYGQRSVHCSSADSFLFRKSKWWNAFIPTMNYSYEECDDSIFWEIIFYSSFSWRHDFWTAHKWSGKTLCIFNWRFSRKSFCNIIQLIAVRPSTFIATSEEIYSCTQNFRQLIISWRD